jgi:hypothetical protein
MNLKINLRLGLLKEREKKDKEKGNSISIKLPAA